MRYEWRTHSKGDGSCELEEVPLEEGLGFPWPAIF